MTVCFWSEIFAFLTSFINRSGAVDANMICGNGESDEKVSEYRNKKRRPLKRACVFYCRMIILYYLITYRELIDSSLYTRRIASANMAATDRIFTFGLFPG